MKFDLSTRIVIVSVLLVANEVFVPFVQAGVGDLCSAGFAIHTPGAVQLLMEGASICPSDYPKWNVEALCTSQLSQVIIKLYDETNKLVVRRGNDKTPADGWYWNAKPTTYTNATKELVVGRKYCFYAHVGATQKLAKKVCFNAACGIDYDYKCKMGAPRLCNTNDTSTYCAYDVDSSGGPFCMDANQECGGAAECKFNSDCKEEGQRCVPTSCCNTVPVCLYECGMNIEPPYPGQTCFNTPFGNNCTRRF